MRKTPNIIGIGELLWDVLPKGKRLGGAPCNFAYHAQKLGANAFTISAVGDDENGKEILDELNSKNISAEFIQVNDKSTGTVDVFLNEQGVPTYTIHEDVAWDFILFNNSIEQKIIEADIICFGSLAQRNSVSRETIEKFLESSKPGSFIVFDVNLRQDYYSRDIIEKSLQLSNVVKLNEDELPLVCNLLGITGSNEMKQIHSLIEKYKLKLVAFTKGTEGSILSTVKETSYMPTPTVDVKDTVGAGDSFTAALMLGFLKGESLKEIHRKAVEISAFVCTQNGAMPEYQ